jgi:hypothetical protein
MLGSNFQEESFSRPLDRTSQKIEKRGPPASRSFRKPKMKSSRACGCCCCCGGGDGGGGEGLRGASRRSVGENPWNADLDVVMNEKMKRWMRHWSDVENS